MSIDSRLDPAAGDLGLEPVPASSADAPILVQDRLEIEKPYVTAVLVIHDGAQFLPRTLDALEAQTRRPDALIGADAGSADDGLALLREATPHVLELGRETSFGDAVRAALARFDRPAPEPKSAPGEDSRRSEWVWLVHDDSAPAADALQRLLDVVDQGPSIGIAGCKQVSWDDSRRLLDAGFTTSALGARITGVDTDDIDQGQLDHRTDVLAVGTAGMLVRRDVWDQLDGPDPALSHARADLDLCQRAHLAGLRVVVVPSAVMAYAAATATGRRDPEDVLAWAVRDRRAAVHLRLAAAPWFLVPVLLVWLAGAALVRAAGRILLKQPDRAGGELLAFGLAVASPVMVWRARRRIRRRRVIRWRDFRRLQAGPRQVLRQRRDALATHLRTQEAAWAGRSGVPAASEAPETADVDVERPLAARDLVAIRSETALRTGREVTWDGDRVRGKDTAAGEPIAPAGPSADDDEDVLAWSQGAKRYLRPSFTPDGELRSGRAPAITLRLTGFIAVLMAGVALAALRPVLSGTGQLLGPALLPSPDAAGQLWQTAVSAWRPVELGAPAAGDPFSALLALLAWPLGGSVQAATGLVLFGALPLAALGAYWAAGAVTGSRALRAWTAVVWAASPSLLLAIGTGRLGAVTAHVVLPLTLLAMARTFGVARRDETRDRPGGTFTAASAGGLLITVLIAAAPMLAVPVVLALLLGFVLSGRARRRRRSAVWMTAVPAVLLLPWWAAVAQHPQLLLAEPGGPSGSAAELDGASTWQFLFWPIDPAHLIGTPIGSLARRVAELLTPLVPAMDAATVLRGMALVLALPVLVFGLSAVLIRPAAARWVRARAIAVCWTVAVAAALLAVLLPLIPAGTGANGGTMTWPGTLVSLLTAAVVAASLGRLDGAAARLRLRNAGWRHIGSVGFGAVAVLLPLCVLAGWVATGWDAPARSWVHRGAPDVVPAVAVAEAEGPAAARTLVLRADERGVHWVIRRAGGPRSGDWSAAFALSGAGRSSTATGPMLPVIGGLLSGPGNSGAAGGSSDSADPRAGLAEAGIGSILLLRGSDPQIASSLDTAPGLARVATTTQGQLWRVELDGSRGPTRPARARVMSNAGGSGAVLSTLPSDGDVVEGSIPAGRPGRVLVLAERSDPGWHAWADGHRLVAQTHDGWAQAFALPLSGGHVRVAYEPGGAGSSLGGLRLVVVAVALLGALPLPVRRRRLLPPPARIRAAASPPPASPRPAGRRAALPEPRSESEELVLTPEHGPGVTRAEATAPGADARPVGPAGLAAEPIEAAEPAVGATERAEPAEAEPETTAEAESAEAGPETEAKGDAEAEPEGKAEPEADTEDDAEGEAEPNPELETELMEAVAAPAVPAPAVPAPDEEPETPSWILELPAAEPEPAKEHEEERG